MGNQSKSSARFTGLAVAVAIAGLGSAATYACSTDTPTPISETWTASTHVSNGARITIFTGPVDHGSELQIASGIGGALWVAMPAESAFLKLTTRGRATIYTTPTPNSSPEAITLSGKEMWFTEFDSSCYGFITSAGKITEVDDKLAINKSTSITTGTSGDTWFVTDLSGIGVITSKATHKQFNLPDNSSQPTADILGPDGNIWFVEAAGNNVGFITPAGKVTECNVGFNGFSNSFGIASGSDGRIWFADPQAQRIGAIKTDCTGLTYYTNGLTGQPDAIVAGPDGNLYFGEFSPTIGRITTAGVVTEYPLPTSEGTFPVLSLTVGPDGNIWFSNNAHSQVGKLILP